MQAQTTSAAVCPECGTRLTGGFSRGLGRCMICLLRVGFDDAQEPDERLFAPVTDRLGIYRIERHDDGTRWELGRGATGVTYRAIDTSLQRPVALKLIDSERLKRGAEARGRFMREARTAASLRHPNVATVYHFGIREETGQCFCAMELVEGETLEMRVRRTGPLDALTTIEIALQITSALATAEKQGLVHRDLKPANLMVVETAPPPFSSSNDNATRASHPSRKNATKASHLLVKIIDFGVAKALVEKPDAMGLTHGGFVGTPAFASPEQFTDAPVDVRSDIYSLGATLWYLLTGHRPFEGATIEQIRASQRSRALPIEQLKAARVPSRLISLLVSMLAPEPAARPSVRALTSQLQDCRAQILDRSKIVKWVALAAALVTLVIGWNFWKTELFRAAPKKSIAVLPFENLSPDPDNAYFADGMQDEILTRLANIADLKVISRTSTQRYQSKPHNLSQIAKQLGVANILEGSVQKAGDQVRVNVQLINAQTDAHLWAETYDRKLTDVLLVESEIARGIAESLQAKLTGREKQALAVKPTNSPDAYEAYLRGLSVEARTTALWEAAGFYERAVQLDPNFALAWARLSRADADIYFDQRDTSPGRRDAAKRALANAQKLAPDSPETLLALGYYQYRVLGDYGAAKNTFDRVSEMLPGSSEVPYALAEVARREGQWDQSIAYYEQALALDPRNVDLLRDAALTYSILRQFPDALKLYDRALDIIPNDPEVMAAKANIYRAQGNLQEAAKFLSGIDWQTPSESAFLNKIAQLRLERNYGEAIRLLQARLAQFDFPSQYEKGVDQVELALTQRLAGDTANAKGTAEQARNALELVCKDQPDNAFAWAALAEANALTGERDLALKLGARSLILLPSTKDPVVGPVIEAYVAFIQTICGETSRAISTLARLLQTPSVWPLTPSLLRLDPVWDSLRTDPAFQKLCEESQPPAAP
jgi:serine/threonine protein kinase/Tfp pilus assembly protein PilF